MTTELTNYNFNTTVITKKGTVEIVGYEETLKYAEEIRKALLTVVVTEDTIQANKKLLAKLNKAFNEIDSSRKAAKREYLEPFTRIDEQCKELKKVVDEAVTAVRSQIRELEEIQREEKEQEIKEIWDKRVERLDYKPILKFENFLEPRFLNKSISMNKVEEEMTAYLSRAQDDIKALEIFTSTNDYDFNRALRLYEKYRSLNSVLLELDKDRKESEETQRRIEQIEMVEPEEDYEWMEILIPYRERQRVFDLLNSANISYVAD